MRLILIALSFFIVMPSWANVNNQHQMQQQQQQNMNNNMNTRPVDTDPTPPTKVNPNYPMNKQTTEQQRHPNYNNPVKDTTPSTNRVNPASKQPCTHTDEDC